MFNTPTLTGVCARPGISHVGSNTTGIPLVSQKGNILNKVINVMGLLLDSVSIVSSLFREVEKQHIFSPLM